MNRRNFIKSSSLLALSAPFIIMSGCSSTNVATPEFILEHDSNLLSVIDNIKMTYEENIKTMNDIGLIFNEDNNDKLDIEFSLPWYIGSKIGLSSDKYFIKKYTSEDLLFLSFGIKDKINLFFFNDSYNGLSSNKRAIELGFNSIIDLYTNVLYKLTSNDPIESLIYLKYLEKNSILEVSNLLNYNKIKEKNEKVIKNLFSNYLKIEEEFDTYNINNQEIKKSKNIDSYLKEWKYSINDKRINFIKEDFEIYTLSILITENILKNTKKETTLNE
jgi:hypothetical protein